MQDSETSLMFDLDKELDLMQTSIIRNEAKIADLKLQESESAQKIKEADALFT